MPVNKLDPTLERKIIRGIEKVIGMTRSGVSANEAFTKVANELQFSPEIIHRACEAFNKSKSVHVMTKSAAAQRANSFEIADPAAVVDSLFGGMQKAAQRGLGKTLPALKIPAMAFGLLDQGEDDEGDELPDETVDEMPGATLEEVLHVYPDFAEEAVADSAAEDERNVRTDVMLSKEARMNEVRDLNLRSSMLEPLVRAKSLMGQHKTAFEMAIKDATAAMLALEPPQMRKVAQAFINRFGEDGSGLLAIVATASGKPLVLEKTASYAVLPICKASETLCRALREARTYRGYNEGFQKIASLAKTANGIGSAVKLLSGAGTGMVLAGTRGAAGGIQSTHRAIGGFLDATMSNYPSADYVTDAVLDPRFTNMMDTLNNQQAFVGVATDPVMSKYPIEDVRQAYNNTVSVMPQLEQERFRPFLSSLVRRQLAQNRMFDPAEMSQLATTSQALAKTEEGEQKMDKAKQDALRNLVAPGPGGMQFGEAADINPLTNPVVEGVGRVAGSIRTAASMVGKKDKSGKKLLYQPGDSAKGILTGTENAREIKDAINGAVRRGKMPGSGEALDDWLRTSGVPEEWYEGIRDIANKAAADMPPPGSPVRPASAPAGTRPAGTSYTGTAGTGPVSSQTAGPTAIPASAPEHVRKAAIYEQQLNGVLAQFNDPNAPPEGNYGYIVGPGSAPGTVSVVFSPQSGGTAVDIPEEYANPMPASPEGNDAWDRIQEQLAAPAAPVTAPVATPIAPPVASPLPPVDPSMSVAEIRQLLAGGGWDAIVNKGETVADYLAQEGVPSKNIAAVMRAGRP